MCWKFSCLFLCLQRHLQAMGARSPVMVWQRTKTRCMMRCMHRALGVRGGACGGGEHLYVIHQWLPVCCCDDFDWLTRPMEHGISAIVMFTCDLANRVEELRQQATALRIFIMSDLLGYFIRTDLFYLCHYTGSDWLGRVATIIPTGWFTWPCWCRALLQRLQRSVRG